MIRYILSLCLGFVLFSAAAHQADISSTVLAEQEDGHWVLQIKSSLTAFEYEIENAFGESAYATPEEFQELVIKHLQEHISINIDQDVKVILENGAVSLGHETNIVFRVKGMPIEFDNIAFTNSSFKNINRNQSALIILKKGLKQNQFVLNNENQHSIQLEVQDMQFEEATSEAAIMQASPSLFLGVVSLFVLVLLLFFKIRR